MYRVILTGVREGVARSDALKNLATLFKTTPEQVEKLLATPDCIVKKGITEDVSGRYRAAIEAAGGACRVANEIASVQAINVELPNAQPVQEIPKSNFKAAQFPGLMTLRKIGLVSMAILLLLFIAMFMVNRLKESRTENTTAQAANNVQFPLKGTYHFVNNNPAADDAMATFYADGAYINSFYRSDNQGNDITDAVSVGMCQQTNEQMDCRETGSWSPDTNSFSPTNNTELTYQLKKDVDGSFSMMGIKRVVDGKPQPLNNLWMKFVPIHADNQTELESKMRQGIPAQFFTDQSQRAESVVQAEPQTTNNPRDVAAAAMVKLSLLAVEFAKSTNPTCVNLSSSLQSLTKSAYKQIKSGDYMMLHGGVTGMYEGALHTATVGINNAKAYDNSYGCLH